ncbi:MAG: MGMT family protein [Leptospiraceae bacterium]
MSQMKQDILKVVSSIPEGKVCTYGDIARFLTISPRNVAFALAGMSKEESRRIPWQRVVSAGGWLNRDRKAGDKEQEKRLISEGVRVVDQKVDLAIYAVDVRKLKSGIRGGRFYGGASK